MNDKVLNVLEFDKIVERLRVHSATSLGRGRTGKLRPVSGFEEAKQLLRETDEASAVLRLKGAPPFAGISDIQSALHRVRIGGVLNCSELLDVSRTAAGGRRLKKFLAQIHEENPLPLLISLCETVTDLRALEEEINFCIGDDAEVLDSASPELKRIRQEIRLNQSRARDRLEQMVRNPSTQKMLQESLITLRGDRYVLPVKQEYRNYFGGLVHDQSASGATLFIEPEAVLTVNNKLRELKSQEEREIERILRKLSEQTAVHADELLSNVQALAQLDFIFAKSALAREMKATLPILNDRGFIKLKKGRHPLIAADRVVPIDIEMGNRCSAVIITGPNTGGKTVTLKTVGLLSLMAMSGLFIPAEDGSQMCVFDAIYADIGDEQSIEQSLSTFSSHLTNIVGILQEMTPKSLVLLDELGAGTDPAEGSALAVAILEYIHRIGCRIMATTHYSELKTYAYERKGIVNASMEFNVQTLSPSYRLLVGVPGRSNAFAIAQRLGLPNGIIEQAKERVTEEDRKVDSMLATLEENRATAEAERQLAEQLRKEVVDLRRGLIEQREAFDRQKEKMLEKAEKEARGAVAKARREAEEIIADLRKLAMEEQASIKEHKLIDVKRRLNEAEPQLKEKHAVSKKRAKPETVSPGDEVRVLSLGQKGHVVEEASDREVVIQLGVLKMKVDKSDLERIGSPEKNQKQQSARQVTTVKRTRDEHIRSELDLRGSNLADAILEVDRFLDEAFLANLKQVYIIHGKGTGVLRTGITEFMRKHRLVKHYRLGNFAEGGTGVTVVELA